MNATLKIFLSMSFSGALLILALLFGKRFLKDKISRQWQYYIWMIVILRLLLPFESSINFMGKYYRAMDQAIVNSFSEQQFSSRQPENISDSAVYFDQSEKKTDDRLEQSLPSDSPIQKIILFLINNIQVIWLIIAVTLLIRKITIYQSFMRYINAGLMPVSDMEILDQFFITAKKVGIKKPIELCVNPLVSSPLLVGFFHPCIVLPGTDISEKDFRRLYCMN